MASGLLCCSGCLDAPTGVDFLEASRTAGFLRPAPLCIAFACALQLAEQSEWIDDRDYYAEMHAYSLAAAMAGVRHRGSNTSMHQTLRLPEQGTGAPFGL